MALALATLAVSSLPVLCDVTFSAKEMDTILRLSPLDPSKFADPTNAYCNNEGAQRYGEMLFFDRRLSADGQISCADCHDPQTGWAGSDSLEQLGRKPGRRPPTLWNVAYHRWYNWDGSADSLWAQCLGPLENENEMASTRIALARTIQQEADLRAVYERVFGTIPISIEPERLPTSGRPVPQHPDHLDHRRWLTLSISQREEVNRVFVNLSKAIAAFEATIISTDAPFDRFVEGLRNNEPEKLAAISSEAKRGLKLFMGRGRCVLCHSGPNFSDSEFHNVFVDDDSRMDLGRWSGIDRLRKSEFNSLSMFNDADPGQTPRWVSYLVRSPETKHRFKTPTLRNAAHRAPYMHKGQLATLEHVIDHYDRIGERMDQKDRHVEMVLDSLYLTDTEKHELIAFLHSLTDERFAIQLELTAKR